MHPKHSIAAYACQSALSCYSACCDLRETPFSAGSNTVALTTLLPDAFYNKEEQTQAVSPQRNDKFFRVRAMIQALNMMTSPEAAAYAACLTLPLILTIFSRNSLTNAAVFVRAGVTRLHPFTLPFLPPSRMIMRRERGPQGVSFGRMHVIDRGGAAR